MLVEHILSHHLVIHHPHCPKCGTKMYVARLQPEKPDQDRLTFECPECKYVETKIVRVH